MFFPFSSVSNQTYLLRKNRYQLTVFDRLNSYTISSLTEEEAILLSFFDENDQIKLPSGGTLHHFVKYRLGEERINEVMMLIGEKILKLLSEKEAKIDSTPLEASRYDENADYHPHYGCNMDKAHILS